MHNNKDIPPQDLSELLQSMDSEQHLGFLKERIMNEVRNKPSPYPYQRKDQIMKWVGWTAGIVLLVCIVLIIIGADWSGFFDPTHEPWNLKLNFDLNTPRFFDRFSQVEFPELHLGKLVYYLGGAIGIFWSYYLLNLLLTRAFTALKS